MQTLDKQFYRDAVRLTAIGAFWLTVIGAGLWVFQQAVWLAWWVL